MSPLILLVGALVVAVALQAFVRNVVAPRRRWVSTGRPRIAMARRRSISEQTALAERDEVRERAAELSDWENEGGAPADVRTAAARGTVR